MKEKNIYKKIVQLKNIKWILLVICIILFSIILKNVSTQEIIFFDTIGYDTVSTYLMSNRLTPTIKVITQLGGTIWLIVMVIILSFTIKNKKIVKSIALNLPLSALVNYIVKHIVKRPRPLEEYRLIKEKGYSLPSGHSMVSMAFYGFLIYLIYKYIKNLYLKITLIAILSLIILMVGISRIYLGVHYTTDVLSGFFVAISYLIIYISIINETILNEKK